MPSCSFTLSDFKSYGAEATLPLATVTFLVGANASGKSNALEALRLLSWLASGKTTEDVEKILQGDSLLIRGQSADLFHNPARPLTLRFLQTWEANEGGEPPYAITFALSLTLRAGKLEIAKEEIFHGRPDGTGKQVYYRRGHDGTVDMTETKKTALAASSRIAFAPLPPSQLFLPLFPLLSEAKTIPLGILTLRHALHHIFFLKPQPDLMRDYVHSSLSELREDGGNLSAALHTLCQDRTCRDLLLGCIRNLPEQNIVDIRFIKTERSDVMLRLEEEFAGKKRLIDAPLLSDGTLRVLAVAAALLSVPEGTVLVIEEIDNGIHPSRAGLLISSIREIAAQRRLRVLLTAHNPALLDALPDAALPDVVGCYRHTEDGDSRMTRLGDLERYPELMEQGSLGKLMASRALERFLRDKRDTEVRKKEALAWLDNLERDVED